MNKADFKRYMKQGLGRWMLTLKNSGDISKYREIVLWGCLHNLSFDTQCEGTRAIYVHELTSCFRDAGYFVNPVIEALEKTPYRSGWLFLHYLELLRMFADDGNTAAGEALRKMYGKLLTGLINKRRFNGYDYERDAFERVCISLTADGNTEVFINIADDIGSLFKQNKHYDNDFDWFYGNSESKYGKKKLNTLLKRESEKSENIRYFYDKYRAYNDKWQYKAGNPSEAPDTEKIKAEIVKSGKLSAASRVKFSRKADDEEKRKLAEAALQERDPLKKAELLSPFTLKNRNFPLSHKAIAKYSESDCERLSDVAFQVLTNCQSETARQYAYKLLEQRSHVACAIQIILNNYTREDKETLLTELYNIRVDYSDESEWHEIGFKILDAYDSKIKIPKELLLYIYDTTLCSCCRESAVRLLAKNKWLTDDIIEECRYDSNRDISGYINRYYPQK